MTVSCKRCGHRFETGARPGGKTSCPACRVTVYVPKGTGAQLPARAVKAKLPALVVLDLSCGHRLFAFDPEVSATKATGYLWSCDEGCPGEHEVVAVVATLSEVESAALDDDAFMAWATGLPAPARTNIELNERKHHVLPDQEPPR